MLRVVENEDEEFHPVLSYKLSVEESVEEPTFGSQIEDALNKYQSGTESIINSYDDVYKQLISARAEMSKMKLENDKLKLENDMLKHYSFAPVVP